jgi:hypothetical protein
MLNGSLCIKNGTVILTTKAGTILNSNTMPNGLVLHALLSIDFYKKKSGIYYFKVLPRIPIQFVVWKSLIWNPYFESLYLEPLLTLRKKQNYWPSQRSKMQNGLENDPISLANRRV